MAGYLLLFSVYGFQHTLYTLIGRSAFLDLARGSIQEVGSQDVSRVPSFFDSFC
jgi:hypothetical protein